MTDGETSLDSRRSTPLPFFLSRTDSLSGENTGEAIRMNEESRRSALVILRYENTRDFHGELRAASLRRELNRFI